MPVTSRLRAIVLHRHCFKCLGHDHLSSRCTSKERCHVCEKDHHTLLHEGPKLSDRLEAARLTGSPRNKEKTEHESHSDRGARKSVRDVRTGLGPRSSHSTRRRPRSSPAIRDARSKVAAPQSTASECIMIQPTAVLKLILHKKVQFVRALIDPGAPYTRISADLARKLRLSCQEVDGAQVTTLDIRGKHGNNETVKARARVTKGYSVVTPSESIDASIKNMFPGIVFADSKFYESGPVELVVGMDVYAKVIRNGVMGGTHNQLLAQMSIFGYLISGMYHK